MHVGLTHHMAQLHMVTGSKARLATCYGACAGDYLPNMEELQMLMRTVEHLCCADEYEPLAVELFYGGVLSALLRVAQRVVAAQPHAEQEEKVAEHLFHECLTSVVKAFGVAVPQARPNKLRIPQSAC